MNWIIEDIENIPVIACGLFYALLCVFSIVTGLIYVLGLKELNPVELSDKTMQKYSDPDKLREFAAKMGFVTIFVGFVQGLAAFCLFKGYSPIWYWIALGFTIFSICSVLFKLKGKISAFPIIKLVFYLLILIILLLSSTRDLFFSEMEVEEDNELIGYRINYSIGYKIYRIEPKEDNIKVTVLDVIICDMAPCDPIERDSYKVKYTSEYRKTLKGIVKDKKKEFYLYEEDLSDAELEVINDLVGIEEPELTYRIISGGSDYSSEYGSRGFYVYEKSSGEVLVTVAKGACNTGGYSISISKVKIDNDNVKIYVKEKEPAYGDIVTQAFTYPIAQVEFSKMPKDISVINIDTSYEFERINVGSSR